MTDDEEGGSLAVGDRVGGKYRITRVLGRGGMGIVYEALQVRLDRKVALKMLHRTMLASSSVVERFEREARAAAKLKGPHVADVLDVDVTEQGIPFIVMEYLEGRDLGQELESRIMLPMEEAIGCVLQACSAMAEAHKAGIVHRDLKPANLFLHTDGDGYIVKVLDFGISKMTESEQQDMTMTRSTLGTPLYMSPEQIRSTKHVDGRTDVWAMGVILFESLSGSLPFTGENPSAVIAAITADEPLSLSELCPDLPPGLCDVVNRALAKSPAQRFQTVDELALALLPFAGPNAQWGKGSGRKRQITSPDLSEPLRAEAISGDAATMASAPEQRAALASLSPSGARTVRGNVVVPASEQAVPSRTLESQQTERPPASQQQASRNSVALAGAAESKITAGAWSTEQPGTYPKRTWLIAGVAGLVLLVSSIVLLRGGGSPADADATRPAPLAPALANPRPPAPATLLVAPAAEKTAQPSVAASATPSASSSASSSAVPAPAKVPATRVEKSQLKPATKSAPASPAPTRTEQNPMHL